MDRGCPYHDRFLKRRQQQQPHKIRPHKVSVGHYLHDYAVKQRFQRDAGLDARRVDASDIGLFAMYTFMLRQWLYDPSLERDVFGEPAAVTG